jgi:hypothetical protein
MSIRVYLDEKDQQKLMTELTDLRMRVKEISDMGYYTLTEIRAALKVGVHPTTEELRMVDFDDRGRVHDWRNYARRSVWTQLTDLERLLDYAMSATTADAEEWD